MPWHTVKLKPGINTELTSAALESGYTASNNLRFRAGMAEKLGGCTKYIPSGLPGLPLHSHAFEDLANNARLAVGTTSNLLDVTGSVVSDVTPQTLTTNPAINFSTSSGSATVTIVDTQVSGITPQDAVYFNTPVAVGGLILAGLYAVASQISSTSYTITAASNATGNVSNGGAVPAFTTTNGSFIVSVSLAAHGLSAGSDIVFPIATTVGGCTIQGRYVVQSVTNANAFTINAAQVASSGAGPTSMNSGKPQFVYSISIGPLAPTSTVQVIKTTTGAQTWTVPGGVYAIQAEAIGGGDKGGGAYAKSTPVTVTPGQTVYLSVGAAAADSWVNVSANSAPTLSSQGVLAKAASGSTGGQAASCVGTLTYSGGSAGANGSGSGNNGVGGGGGAAGPSGAGKNGGSGSSGSASSGGSTVYYGITAGAGGWTVPAGVTSLSLQAVGPGGNGYYNAAPNGGGGGAYASSYVAVTPKQTIYYSIGGSGSGSDTWVNVAGNSPPASSANGCLAKAGANATAGTYGSGGLAASCVGATKYSGGNGGTGASEGCGGGGGAGGPSGNGGAGGNGYNSSSGYSGGGGGSNGGTNGGNATSSSNGTAGSPNGGAGSDSISNNPGTSDGSLGGGYGTGGGGGGCVAWPSNGGDYGGGGGGDYLDAAGSGGRGILLIAYTAPSVSGTNGAHGGGGGSNGGSSTAGISAFDATGGDGGAGTSGSGGGYGTTGDGFAGSAGGGGGGGQYGYSSGNGGSDTAFDGSHGSGGGGGGNASGGLYGGGGSAGGAQGIVVITYTATFTSQPGTAITATDYTIDNWGSYLTACPDGGAVYYWDPASGFTNASVISQAPPFNAGAFVSIAAQQVVVYGSSVSADIGVYQDPLMVRWCDVGDFTTWSPLITNQAGSYRLTNGSKIVGGMAGPSTTNYLWTDLNIWQMTYIGSTLVYGFQKIADNCGLIARHAYAALNSGIYWMGANNFFMLRGGAVTPIPCSVWDAVFQNINRSYVNRCFAGPNTTANEVLFFFPSSNSTGYCDSCAKLNTLENTWDISIGTFQRNTWIDVSVISNPIATDASGYVYAHESGRDNAGSAMSSSFTTGFFALSEGQDVMFVDRIYPDFKWGEYGGSHDASLQITVRAVKYAGATPLTFGPFTVTAATPFISKRMRGRFFSLDVASSDLGSFWRLGAVKFRGAPDGRGV